MLADGISARIEESWGAYCPTIVVDSMQVYREIPVITNQARERPAELLSVVSVTEDWTVAHHREMAREIIGGSGPPVVLDAGTGMYLNSIILDFPLAPKASTGAREKARIMALGEENPRRAARGIELGLSGEDKRGSVWDGEPVYEVSMLYLRPMRYWLDERIRERSVKIAEDGLEEAELLLEMTRQNISPNVSVRDSIGVRELMSCVLGEIPRRQAANEIETRTRRLARRQMRWFDKLARTLAGRVEVLTIEDPEDRSMLRKLQIGR